MAAFYRIPTCCTGLTLAGFNGSTLDQQKDQIFHAMRNSDIREYYSNIRTFAMVMATTTAQQRTAKEALEEIGFSSVGPFTKDKRGQRHKETGALTLHYINANDLQDWIDAEKKRREAPQEKQQKVTRRFGRVASPAQRRHPSCTIRDMQLRQFIMYYHSGNNEHRFRGNTVGADRFRTIYGITVAQYDYAWTHSNTISGFANLVRRFQRENNGSN